MTVAELIEKLKSLPQDMEILVERGEWGPQQVKKDPSVQPVLKYHPDDEDWVIDYFPEVRCMDEEVHSQAVIL